MAGPRARVRVGEDGTVRLLYGAHVAPWSGDAVRDALAFTQRFGDALGVPQGAELRPEPTQTWHGFTIVRLRRVVDGRPVIGASVVVRFLADGAIDLVMSGAGPARVLAGDAIDAARATAIARGIDPGWAIEATTAPSAVAMQVADAIVPLWSIDLHGASLSQRVRALLDARDGRVLTVTPLGHDVTGRVFETNPTSTMGVTSDFDLPELTSGERLTGRHFRVSSCNAQASGDCAAAQLAVADADGNFLYDPDARAFDDGFAEVNAYYHLSRAAAYHRENHGFTWTCGSNVMNVLVNFTERPMTAYDNAAFYPSSGGSCGFLIFGQGTSSDYAYDGDVVYHELGHAVTDQVAGITGFLADLLGVTYEPLAVNEGTSDYWAGTLQGDGSIAESFSGLGAMGSHGSLRMIENDLTCPSSLFGEGHYDGRIWGGTAWELRQTLGAETVDPLVFTTIASITEDPSLAEAGDLLVATAMGMEAMGALSAAEVATVESVVTARGLPMCQRVVPLDDGELRQGWSGSEYQTGGLGKSIAPVHYRIDVPADARSLTLDVGRLTFSGAYAVHVRVLGPVRVNIARVTSDIRIPVSGTIRFDADSELPLPRCQTMYIAIESTDLSTAGQSVYTIRAALERTGSADATCPEPEGDAGTAPADGGIDGADGGTPA
ncbi:MAG: M4 family metallopeptidase, partial [Myxococcota bacterium]|nr:M4 family metallopeptidase [Myxococcota bacterium]